MRTGTGRQLGGKGGRSVVPRVEGREEKAGGVELWLELEGGQLLAHLALHSRPAERCCEWVEMEG